MLQSLGSAFGEGWQSGLLRFNAEEGKATHAEGW
jgi:hypothetical protein